MSSIEQNYFPKEIFNCYYEKGTDSPLVISPRSRIDLIDWSQKNQLTVANAINKFGALVFSGFNLTKETFSKAFTAITGMPPQLYKGDTPRDQVSFQVYKSTAVAKEHTIPFHQEVSGNHDEMPKYISFFCHTPSKEGTGHTTVGNAKQISEKIQKLMPPLWQEMSTKKLTYTATYLPTNGWRTRLIKWLNPSHATIMQRFGTEKREEIEEKCRQEGLTCKWDGNWAVISREGVPATIERNGKPLFCNQIHLDKLNPALCGGWIKYILARILLYPTSRSMQFNVKWSDGKEISPKIASALLTIIKKHQESHPGRNWKKGDLMVLDNVTTMHGKTSHLGEREILVAMSGSAVKN